MHIKIFSSKVSKEDLSILANASYVDMVKGVVDLKKNVLALGGELHADAEEVLLNEGSKQEDLWGFNIFLNRPQEEAIEYTSMINIRPRQGNMGREVQDINVRKQIKSIIDAMVQM